MVSQEEVREKLIKRIISHAVTKGLDPDAPMKDSGVEWIGEMPATWNIVQLRRIIKDIDTGSTPKGADEKYYSDDGISWYTPEDFYTFPELTCSIKKLSKLGKEVSKIFLPNSVLMIGIGATMGKVALATKECSANQQINAICCSDYVNPYFLVFFINSINDYLFKCGKFTTLPILNQSETKNIKIGLPPISDQDKIVAFISEKCSQIDALISEKQKLYDKLTDYKKSLIYECVTGKREVPNAE